MSRSLPSSNSKAHLQPRFAPVTYEVHGPHLDFTESLFAAQPTVPPEPPSEWKDPDPEFRARWWPDLSGDWE